MAVEVLPYSQETQLQCLDGAGQQPHLGVDRGRLSDWRRGGPTLPTLSAGLGALVGVGLKSTAR